MDKIQKAIAAGEKVDFNIYFAGKDTIADFVGAQDLIITLVGGVAGGFQAVARPGFGMTKGGGEIPWYGSSSLLSSSAASSRRSWRTSPAPHLYQHLRFRSATLDVLVDELMAGPEAFKGKDPIDSFCGMWDTHL